MSFDTWSVLIVAVVLVIGILIRWALDTDGWYGRYVLDLEERPDGPGLVAFTEDHVLDLEERPDGPGLVAFTEDVVGQGVTVVTYVSMCNFGECRWKHRHTPVVANLGSFTAQTEAVLALQRHWEQFHPHRRNEWGPYT